MKLQNLIIIFLTIALPVILVISFFVGLQVDTAALKASYNSYLSNAAHETMNAFQVNTTEDSFVTVSDVKIRDIEAALNVFSSTMATSFRLSGANKSYMMSYVPALLFTLYDGYYIYTPTKSWETGTYSHELKPYVNYVRLYQNEIGSKILTINYTLDNYIAVYYYNGNSYISRAGYLEVPPSNKEEFLSTLTNDDAKKYYNDAWEFTEWFNKEVVDDINIAQVNLLKITRDNGNTAIPGESSTFNDEKYEVIKSSITNNLIQAMHVYGTNVDKDFQMPKLSDEDWAVVYDNICFIAFLQGLPVGNSVYNDYAIVVSSENKEMVRDANTYYINVDDAGNAIGSYHRLWCPHLSADNKILGVNNVELKNQESAKYGNVPACYYCVVRASDAKLDKVNEYYVQNHYPINYNLNARQKAYYSSMAMQKLNLSKLSSFISGSKKLTR